MSKLKTIGVGEAQVYNEDINEKINKLQEQIDCLENKIYKYKINDIVLTKDLRLVKITALVKDKSGYLYKGDYQYDITDCLFRAEEILDKYNPWTYTQILEQAVKAHRLGYTFDYDLYLKHKEDIGKSYNWKRPIY